MTNVLYVGNSLYLPCEMGLQILGRLERNELCKVMLVCKNWKNAAQNLLLWQKECIAIVRTFRQNPPSYSALASTIQRLKKMTNEGNYLLEHPVKTSECFILDEYKKVKRITHNINKCQRAAIQLFHIDIVQLSTLENYAQVLKEEYLDYKGWVRIAQSYMNQGDIENVQRVLDIIYQEPGSQISTRKKILCKTIAAHFLQNKQVSELLSFARRYRESIYFVYLLKNITAYYFQEKQFEALITLAETFKQVIESLDMISQRKNRLLKKVLDKCIDASGKNVEIIKSIIDRAVPDALKGHYLLRLIKIYIKKEQVEQAEHLLQEHATLFTSFDCFDRDYLKYSDLKYLIQKMKNSCKKKQTKAKAVR